MFRHLAWIGMNTMNVAEHIQELVDLETRGWNTQNPDLFLSIIHPDMAWPWPPSGTDHDPQSWIFVMGRFNRERWHKSWQELFDTHELIWNRRQTLKIVVSDEQDAAFAVVDIDTLWRHKISGEDNHWKGRVCKIYTRMPEGVWKLISHTGALDYGKGVFNS